MFFRSTERHYGGPSANRTAYIVGPGTSSGNGYTAIFGSDAGGQCPEGAEGALFQVTNQGKFLVADHHYEGYTPRVIQLTGKNTVTFSDEVYNPYIGTKEDPPFELDTTTGQATFINPIITRYSDSQTTTPQIKVTGSIVRDAITFPGRGYYNGESLVHQLLLRLSSGGTNSLLNGKYTTGDTNIADGSFQVLNAGTYGTNITLELYYAGPHANDQYRSDLPNDIRNQHHGGAPDQRKHVGAYDGQLRAGGTLENSLPK